MRLSRPDSARRHLLGVVNLMAMAGLVMLLWPAAQVAYGFYSQQQLRAQWDAAAGEARHHVSATADGGDNGTGLSDASENYDASGGDDALAGDDIAAGEVAMAPHALSRLPAMVAKSSKVGLHHKQPHWLASPAAWPPTPLIIPDLNLDAVVVQGVTPDELRRGPGHDAQSDKPGGRNCVIAAHRNVGGW